MYRLAPRGCGAVSDTTACLQGGKGDSQHDYIIHYIIVIIIPVRYIIYVPYQRYYYYYCAACLSIVLPARKGVRCSLHDVSAIGRGRAVVMPVAQGCRGQLCAP